MGNSCITAKNPKQSYAKDSVPEGTQTLDIANLPLLNLDLEVSNIQLRQPPAGLVGLRVMIQGLLDWKYDKVQDPAVLTWKQKRKNIIRATEYQLRKMFINFHILDEGDKEIGCLSLNLYLILTGPWRHDFVVNYHSEHSGRLSADIRCAQTVELEMATTKVQVNFLSQHPGQMFHFTLKTEDLVGNSEMTDESYDVETFLYNKKRSYGVDSEGESATYNKRKSMVLEHKKGLQWSNSISQRSYQKQLPGFTIPLRMDSISNYSFHFILWKKSEDDDETFESYGEANIPMAKLFWTDVKGANLNPEMGATREIEIQEPVQFMGKRCGTMVIRCKVTTPKFFQQVLVLTRTELGMTQSGREVSVDKVSECENLKKMRGIKESMLNHMLKSGNLKNEHSEHGMKQYRQHKNNIYQDILRLQRLFLQGSGNAPLFQYGCDSRLLKAQHQMIDIIQKIIPLTDLRQVCVAEAVWRCLKAILFRGEFLLFKVGFTDEQISTINSQPRSKLKKHLQQKILLCESYQAILIKLLNLGMGRFGRKLLDQQFKFIAAISTICYFKISPFREQLLGAVLNIHDSIGRVYCYQNSYKKQSFSELFDWEKRFSVPLSKYGTNKSLLDSIKSGRRWKQIVGKRSTYYFVMIDNWATNVKAVIGWPDPIVCWSAIPGYNILIGSFLREMETRQVHEYPDVMKDANMSLLSNKCLLPIFMKILFSKTNTYQIASTLKCLQLIGAYFALFQYNKQILPSCFDTKLFYVAIKGVLSSKNCFTISKILQIIYMYFNLFSNQFKKEISLLFLGRFFFVLMMNWGRSVRMMFRFLVFYRITVWAKDKEIAQINRRLDDLKIAIVQGEMSIKSKQLESSKTHKTYYQRMQQKLAARKANQIEEIFYERRIQSQKSTHLKTEESVTAPTQITSHLNPDQQSKYLEKSVQKLSDEIDLKSVDGRRGNTPYKGRNRRVSFFDDFEISSITPEEEPYLEIYKTEMEQFLQEFRVWRKTVKDPDHVPRVDIRVPIDKGDIRPDKMEV